MKNRFKTVMAALFAHLQGAVAIPFTASAAPGDLVLSGVSNLDELFPGLPVFGPGIAKGVVISDLDPDTGTITLSQPISAPSATAQFITGFLTTGRRVKPWAQVTAQPAMFLRRTGVIDEAHGTMIDTTLVCEAWIYCGSGQDPDASPDELLSSLEELVRESFTPDDDDRFTIGGRVYWCRIEGKSDISPGDLGGQSLARIPIRITLP